MRNKIFFVFLLFLLFSIPVTVFADSIYFETKDSESYFQIELDDSGNIDVLVEGDNNYISLNSFVKDDIKKEIVDYLYQKINTSDEITYSEFSTLSEYNTNGYLLKICDESNCKAYYNEKLLIPIAEIENGKLGEILTVELEGTLKMIFAIIGAAFAIIPLLFFVLPFFIIVKVIKKSSETDNKQYEIKKSNKNYENKRNRSTPSQRTLSNNFRGNKNDPFDV